MALERIVLNIIPAGELPVFHCSQYENGRPVIIDLVSSDDDAFLVGEGVSVELHCRKVDDNIVTLEPDEVDNNTVTFVSTEQLTACPGDNLCEVVLYADTDPVQTIATLNFILHVEPDPLEGGLTSETQIYNLTEQIEEITQQVIGDDYYNKTEVDDLLDDKADKATTYTKSEVDSALALKADKSDTYTKTQVDNALALKANAADLATVATTGDYDDLLNKPTIPAAQVQSDWEEEDNTDPSYIKNKPDIEDMIANALLSIMPVGTASGSPALFDTELAVPLVNVSCDVIASGGGGTPVSPVPIVGYSQANITANGNTVTIAFGQTVYGCVLDVTRGKLTVTWGQVSALSSDTAAGAVHTSNNGWAFTLSNKEAIYKQLGNARSNINVVTTYSAATSSGFCRAISQFKPLFFLADSDTGLDGSATLEQIQSAFETFCNNYSPFAIYELNTPIEIDVTPEVISAIVGENNVYSDTNGDTTVQYKDSIQHYIDQRT